MRHRLLFPNRGDWINSNFIVINWPFGGNDRSENLFNSKNKELRVHFHAVFSGKYFLLSIYKYMRM